MISQGIRNNLSFENDFINSDKDHTGRSITKRVK